MSTSAQPSLLPEAILEKLYTAFRNGAAVCTDSRKLEKGMLFFALKGPNFNGNLFGAKAVEAGAAFAVIDEAVIREEAPEAVRSRLLLVNDGLTALQQLARHHRRQFSIPVLAITGSNGKTTTKELVAAVLSSKLRVSATKGNLNNHIGVPLTLLDIPMDCEFAIVEMGANHRGEIAELCKIAEPSLGLITNIGSAHLEGFGGPEGVKLGKGELYAYLKAHSGRLVRFSGQKELAELAGDYPDQLTYGFAATDELQGSEMDTSVHAEAQAEVEVERALFASLVISASGEEPFKVQTKLVGAYNYPNILAAACLGFTQHIPSHAIKLALENYEPSNNRSQFYKKEGLRIILDAYNANPTSTAASLEHFANIKGERDKIIILGDMLELGKQAAEAHLAIAKQALQLNAAKVVQVILVGPIFGKLASNVELTQGGEFKEQSTPALHFFEKAEQAIPWFNELTHANYLFLLKGSRGIGLENIVQAFIN